MHLLLLKEKALGAANAGAQRVGFQFERTIARQIIS
jgi:hypothetical protein